MKKLLSAALSAVLAVVMLAHAADRHAAEVRQERRVVDIDWQ